MERGSGIRARLWLSLLEPVDDRVPILGSWVVERRVVRASGEDEQIGTGVGTGEEFVGHGCLKEMVAISLDDKDGEVAIAKGFAG